MKATKLLQNEETIKIFYALMQQKPELSVEECYSLVFGESAKLPNFIRPEPRYLQFRGRISNPIKKAYHDMPVKSYRIAKPWLQVVFMMGLLGSTCLMISILANYLLR